MKNSWVFAGALLVAGVFAACSSSSDSCGSSSECQPGSVCRASKCLEYPCVGTSECSEGEICIAGDKVGKDATKQFCTAGCKVETDCKPGFTCDADGLCIFVVTDDVLVDDALVTDQEGRDGVVQTDSVGTDNVVTDTPVVVTTGACKTCTGDGDCDQGSKCLPVGATKHCLPSCTTDGDCPPSYMCYAASTSSKSCLPATYVCPPCAADEPCEAGKVCDMLASGGACKVGNPECGSCTYDFDCADGMRCYKKTGSPSGVCVAGCSDAKPCADTAKFSCEANEKSVKMCKPLTDDACKACPPEKPFPSDDGLSCWECRNNSQCTVAGETCNAQHECASGTCTKFTCDDGNCHDCCSDSDCPNDSGPCTNYKCENQIDNCNGTCAPPYTVCAEINATWQCVQCSVTADCAGQGSGSCTCTGDPTYSCMEPDGNVCQSATCAAVCQTEVDCPPDSNGGSLACTGGAGGICYNPTGACDGVSSCCAGGSSCYDVLGSLFGGGGIGIPGGGGTMPTIAGYCSCTDAMACLGGKPCTATASMCSFPLVGTMLCPGGVPPATMPEKLCVDIMEILTGILGGI
jgi:hypothetical protein